MFLVGALPSLCLLSALPSAVSLSPALMLSLSPAPFRWEVVELLKRVVLVGLMQLAWYGEVLQVLLGTLLAMSFLLFQLIASPYADASLNLVASISSYCLVVFFSCHSSQVLSTQSVCHNAQCTRHASAPVVVVMRDQRA